MVLLAHLTESAGERKEQSLKDHCFHTAEYASKIWEINIRIK